MVGESSRKDGERHRREAVSRIKITTAKINGIPRGRTAGREEDIVGRRARDCRDISNSRMTMVRAWGGNKKTCFSETPKIPGEKNRAQGARNVGWDLGGNVCNAKGKSGVGKITTVVRDPTSARLDAVDVRRRMLQ